MEENELLNLQSRLRLFLEVENVENSSAALKEIISQIKKSGTTIDQLTNKYGSLDNAIKGLIKEYKLSEKSSTSALKNIKKEVKSLHKDTLNLTYAWSGFAGSVKKLIIPPSFLDASKYTINYQKSIISTAASVSRLEIGRAHV